MKFKNRIQQSVALKRARNKHNPIVNKLLSQTFKHLKKSTDIRSANEFVQERTLDWMRYCAQYSSNSYPFPPSSDGFIDNLLFMYVKPKK